MILLIIIIFTNFIIFKNLIFFSKLVNLTDKPSSRKLHNKTVPLLGGLYFLINLTFLFFFIKLFNYNPTNLYFDILSSSSLLFGYYMFFVIGFIDDKKDKFDPKLRIILSIIILSISLLIDKELLLTNINLSFINGDTIVIHENLHLIFTIICFLILINSLNMTDGINLLASGFVFYLIIVFTFLGVFKIDILILIPFFLFFFFYNNKYKIFLGSSGIMPISYLIGYFFIKSFNQNIILYSDWVFVIIFIPLIEILRVFFLRIRKKSSPFKADQNHLHHYLYFSLGYTRSIIFLLIIYISPFVIILSKVSTLSILFFFLLYVFIVTKYKKN